MSTAFICIAILVLLLIVLAVAVTVKRGIDNRLSGYDPIPDDMLYKLIRAHGNSVEFIPALGLLIYILSTLNPAGWVQWSMILVTASRFLIVIGIIVPKTLAVPNPFRFVGALGTYGFGSALCFALLMQVW